MIRLIGLLGRKRAGKDTLATFLYRDSGFMRYAFADPLRAVLLDTDPIVYTDYHGRVQLRLSEFVKRFGWEAAKETHEVRRLMQAHGVAVRQHVGADVWVNATMTEVDRWLGMTEGSRAVLTDVRFPNEAQAVEDRGGLLVRVVRAVQSGPNPRLEDAHVSETALDGWPVDLTVHNDGDTLDLWEHAKYLCDVASSR